MRASPSRRSFREAMSAAKRKTPAPLPRPPVQRKTFDVELSDAIQRLSRRHGAFVPDQVYNELYDGIVKQLDEMGYSQFSEHGATYRHAFHPAVFKDFDRILEPLVLAYKAADDASSKAIKSIAQSMAASDRMKRFKDESSSD